MFKSHPSPETLHLQRDDAIPPIVAITGYLIASSSSAWKPKKSARLGSSTALHEVTTYRTVFNLYFSPKADKYYLHKLGESTNPKEVTRYSLIEFSSPKTFLEIINNEDDTRIHPSRPLVDLLTAVMNSPLLSAKHREAWKPLLQTEE